MSDLQDLPALLAALLHPSALVEIAVLLACLGLAWLITARLRLRAQPPPAQAEAASPNPPPPSATSVWFGERGFDGALFPVLALGLAVLARLALRHHLPVAVFHLVVPGAGQPVPDPRVGAGAGMPPSLNRRWCGQPSAR